MNIYVYANMYIDVHTCAHTHSLISLLHARVVQVFLNTCMRVWGDWKWGVFQLVHG